ncbi:MAG: 3-phosphoshikimate 1-carboxyvinyltransferase [Lachnospiraceae bacterium]|nr:3-phosphoshikimate 1-carboxyvinyltransferase [Lachnospiraceae bacterium]
MNESTYKVKRIKGPVDFESVVPSSKTVLTRALILSALSDGLCTLKNVTLSQDTRTMMVALRDLGFSIFFSADMKEMRVRGMKGEIPKKEATLFVGDSATAARFISCLLAFSEGKYVINASPLLVSQNMKNLIVALRKLGAKVTCLGKDGHFPIKIEGKRPKENKEFDFTLDISQNTQLASALLMVLPSLGDKARLTTTGSNRDANILLTLKMIDEFGQHITNVNNEYILDTPGVYTSKEHIIEADVSSACYFLSLPLLIKGSASVLGVNFDSMQGDINYLNFLKDLGATIKSGDDGATIVECNEETFAGEYTVDMENFSDEFAIMAIIASVREGKTTIENVGHLRHQECDRIAVMKENLEKCGIYCMDTSTSLSIIGGMPHGSVIETRGDHRTAMAFTMLGLMTGNMAIADYEYVGKTFSEFFEEVEKIR